METAPSDRLRRAVSLLRLGLVAFVLAWFFGPYGLRSAVPVWLPFLVVLALELQFFVAAALPSPARSRRDRLPQAVDRERYGYGDEADDLLLIRREGEELWIPYAGETGDELEALIADARDRREQGERTPLRQTAADDPRPVRRLLFGLGLLAALAAVIWFAETRRGWGGLDAETRAEAADRFSAEAARIAGHRVTIRCDESGDYVGAVQHSDGVAAVGGSLAYLTPERCYDLYRLAFDGEVTFSQTGRALAVLAHESWHLRGLRDEGATECYALQSGVELGRRLGLSEATARRMMRQQLAENALRSGASLEYRIPAGCRDGGSLDLDRRSSDFP